MKLFKVLIPLGASLLAACSGEPPRPDKAEPPRPDKTEVPIVQVADVTRLTGDVEAGRVGFGQCRSCHTVEAGVNRVGPSLHAIVGKPVGTVANYRYSAAMAAAGGAWDEQRLYEFLEEPRENIVGTKMTFAGIKDSQRRADLIAWLKTQAD